MTPDTLTIARSISAGETVSAAELVINRADLEAFIDILNADDPELADLYLPPSVITHNERWAYILGVWRGVKLITYL